MIDLDFSNSTFDTPSVIKSFDDIQKTVGDKHTEKVAWCRLVKDSKESRLKVPSAEGHDDLQKQEIVIETKRYKPNSQRYFQNIGEIWDESISFYLDVLGDRMSTMVLILDELGVNEHKSHAALVKTLKALGDHSKKFGCWFQPNWMDYVNMEMLWRFGSSYDVDALHEDTVDWFSKKKMFSNRKDSYYEHFSKGCDDFVNRFWTRPKKPILGWNEWLASGRWGTTGASDGKRAKVTVRTPRGPRTVKANKTKNATLAVEPWWFYKDVIYKLNPQFNRVSIKPDEAPNKTRLIVASDTPNYLLMAYISTWFESHISGEVSSLFKSASEMADMWLNMASDVNTDASEKIPIDQSHFDHHATAEMVYLAFMSMRKILPDGSDVQKALDRLIANIFSVESIVEFKTETRTTVVSWKNGVPSGWRWTALIDTFINWAQLYTAIHILVEMGYPEDIWSKLVQGDDIDLKTLGTRSAVRYVKIYEATGLEVNSSKFFIAKDRDEFLRRVALRGVGVRGYLARTVHSLLWRSPNSAGASSLTLNEMLESWLNLIRRGGEKSSVLTHMFEDMQGASGLDRSDIENWITTPSTLGGGGLFDAGLRCRHYTRITQTKEYPKFKLATPVLGVEAMAASAGLYLSRADAEKVAVSLTVPMAHYKPQVKTIVERLQPVVPLYPRGTAIYRAKPYWKESFPIHLRPIVIDRIMDPKQPDRWQLAYQYLDVSSVTTFDRLKSNASRNVLRKWLEGGFETTLPKSLRLATDFIRGCAKRFDIYMSTCMSLRKLTMGTIDRVRLWVEEQMVYGSTIKMKFLENGLCPYSTIISA